MWAALSWAQRRLLLNLVEAGLGACLGVEAAPEPAPGPGPCRLLHPTEQSEHGHLREKREVNASHDNYTNPIADEYTVSPACLSTDSSLVHVAGLPGRADSLKVYFDDHPEDARYPVQCISADYATYRHFDCPVSDHGDHRQSPAASAACAQLGPSLALGRLGQLEEHPGHLRLQDTLALTRCSPAPLRAVVDGVPPTAVHVLQAQVALLQAENARLWTAVSEAVAPTDRRRRKPRPPRSRRAKGRPPPPPPPPGKAEQVDPADSAGGTSATALSSSSNVSPRALAVERSRQEQRDGRPHGPCCQTMLADSSESTGALPPLLPPQLQLARTESTGSTVDRLWDAWVQLEEARQLCVQMECQLAHGEALSRHGPCDECHALATSRGRGPYRGSREDPTCLFKAKKLSSEYAGPAMRWWTEEADWFGVRLDRWLAACQGLGHGLGQGYSKLHSSDRAPAPAPARQPRASRSSGGAAGAGAGPGAKPAPRSSFRMCARSCAQRLQSIMSSNSASEPAASSSSRTRRRPANQQPTSAPASAPAQNPATAAAPTAIVFEKCRPRRGEAGASPSLPAVDIVYYPFRVENCVVCRQLGAGGAAAATASSTASCALAAVPCPQEGCCAPYVPTPQQQASGASGALLFRGQEPPPPPSPGLPPPPPRPHCGEREPVISMNQDYIEVRYDRPPPSPPLAHSSPSETHARTEQPPPSYQAAMRHAVFDGRGREDSVIGDLALFSPRLARAPTPRYSAYPYGEDDDDEDDEADDEETIYSRNSVAAVLQEEMQASASWRRRQLLCRPPAPAAARTSARGPARYRSRGKFSSVMYETQRMFEEAFHVTAEEAPVAVQLPARGRHVAPRAASLGHGPAMTRAWSVHGPSPTAELREVEMPHHGLGPGLRSLLSIRRRPAKGGGSGPAAKASVHGLVSEASQAPTVARCSGSGRPQKKVVVGERGLRGPVWPRVILTFDRGVTPYQTRAQ
ncbi:Protein HIR1 [Frankliniella fusca]|uniref:Protein HIR1 n=1 Tax=Frankliniella fusca TaxID=407009 RepID=A0AAE1L9E0_9NEOP|nr:Protein HIR1 [Frankliniella fusca]